MEAPESTNTNCGEETINIKRRRGHEKQGLAPKLTAGCSRDGVLVDVTVGKSMTQIILEENCELLRPIITMLHRT